MKGFPHTTGTLTGLIGLLVVFASGLACAQGDQPTGADWELHALGVTSPDRLAQISSLSRGRPVTIAIVGQGGVSEKRLAPVLVSGNTLEYRMWPDGQPPDPDASTHDTGAARVILDLTLKLGLRVRLLVYHAGESWDTVAEAFERAGSEAEIVTLYQSFWGDVTGMVESIRQSDRALFISPYVEHSGRPTRTCLQTHAVKPWGDGLPNFVTASPLARKAPGCILTPSSRPDEDTEIINFIAPSYYASGAGGTCPSAEVTAAVAAYAVAARADDLRPEDIVAMLREASIIDRESLTSLPEYNDEHVDAVQTQIRGFREPPKGGRIVLDAPGVLNLYAIYQRIVEKNSGKGVPAK